MKKPILISFIFVLVTSCIDNREIWLQEYKSTKCSWDKVQADFKKDSITNSAKYSVQLEKIQTEIQKIEVPIHSEIELLH